MSTVPNRKNFEDAYAGKAPWDITKAQDPFISVADQAVGPVLDAGCGTGENALFFASRGYQVTGIDYLEEPIRRARAKASDRGQSVEFLVKDALTLSESEWGGRFATVIDCGLFHVFGGEDVKRYVRGLAHIVKPGGHLYLMCFSDQEPGTNGPRRVSRQDLSDAFEADWEIESAQRTQFELNPEFTGEPFSEGGPKAWFAIVRRK